MQYFPNLSRMLCCLARLALLGFFVVITSPAIAQFDVKKPFVHKGEAEIAYYGAYYTGTNESIIHGHELEGIVGLTEWLGIDGAAIMEQERNEDGRSNAFKLTEVEAQAKLELIELKENGIGLALFGILGTTTVDGKDENEGLFGPIVTFKQGRASATLNAFAIRVCDIYEHGEKEPDHWNANLNWQLKIQRTERWGFGIEGFHEFADIGNDLHENVPDRHRLGPVVYFDLVREHDDSSQGSLKDEEYGAGIEHNDHAEHGPAVAMAFGVLFGTNEDTADLALKWNLNIEF